jgi:serine/threonine protein kinase
MTEPADSAFEDLKLGETLVESGAISKEVYEETLKVVQATPGAKLKDELVRRGHITEEVVFKTITMSLNQAVSESSKPTALRPSPSQNISRSTQAPPSLGTMGSTKLRGALPPDVIEASKNPKNEFGKYILTKQLGAGGMAVVYKAWDTFLNHYVALKFIKTTEVVEGQTTASVEQVEAFMAEARLAVKLNHPNIARVYELGEIGDKFFMAQYYIDGPNLHEVIHGERGPSIATMFYSDPKRFTMIMRDIASAMAYAHSLAPPIIHRDLKPANVMLDSSGRAFVVDFGLAKELKVGEASMSGVIKGTPKYMAPEQAEGHAREIDHRSDIWALGIILYEMVAGKCPFEAENLHKLLNKIVNDEPPWPRHVVSDRTVRISPSTKGGIRVPRELELVAMKCIHKDKKSRYQSAQELVDDLNRVLQGEAISVSDNSMMWVVGRAVRRVRKNKWTFLALAAGVLALCTGLYFLVNRGPSKADVAAQVAKAVADGDKAMAEGRWRDLLVTENVITGLDRNHPRLAVYRKAREEAERVAKAEEERVKAEEERKRREEEEAEAKLKHLRDELGRLRDAFLSRPSDETLAPLAARLKGTEDESLRTFGREGVKTWWTDWTGGLRNETAAMHGGGKPKAEWLDAGVRGRAEQLQKELAFAERAWKEGETLGLTAVDLARPQEQLKAILAWRGTFEVVADVKPWATVKLSSGGREIALDAERQENVTPLRIEGVPVGAVRIELSNASGTASVDVKADELRPGAVLRVWGRMPDGIRHRIE